MSRTGIVFDFNGTLFWDTDFQNRSWDDYLRDKGMNLSLEEKHEHVHGRNGKDTFEYLFNRKLTVDEVQVLCEEKEIYYRTECEKQPVSLAPGVEDLLTHLRDHNVPIAIATASGKTNVDYFIKKFDLHRFFEPAHIVYNDGTIAGKPNPDLFLIAMNNLGLKPENTIIFEDSSAGIKSAENAQANRVVIVNSTGYDYSNYEHSVITHFDQFDRSALSLTPLQI